MSNDRSHLSRFLDKSAVITPEDRLEIDGSASNSWRLCSIQQVEEMKCVLRVIPIWASAIIYHLASAQSHTYMIFQALQMDRHFTRGSNFQKPAVSYTVFTSISLTLWIPVYDHIIAPALRRITGKVLHKSRSEMITILFLNNFISFVILHHQGGWDHRAPENRSRASPLFAVKLSMVAPGLIEERRREEALTRPTLGLAAKGGVISSMSGFRLVPRLALGGLSKAFVAIGLVEFYYKQFPENMRSIAGAFTTTATALSSYLSRFVVWIVHHITVRSSSSGDWLPEDLNKGRLDRFYFLIAALGVLNCGYFLVCARWYGYKGDIDRRNVELALEEASGPGKYTA